MESSEGGLQFSVLKGTESGKVKEALYECPKGHVEKLPITVEHPTCGKCNYRRPQKPYKTCEDCKGSGHKYPTVSRKCMTCDGHGMVSPSFTEEEKK